MTRLLVTSSRLLFSSHSFSLLAVLITLVLGNMLMAATLLSPGGLLTPPSVENPGSIFALAWFAGNATAAVLLTYRLVTTLIGQVQEWIASAISASVG